MSAHPPFIATVGMKYDPTRQVVSAVVWDYTPILDDAIVETSAALDAITAAYPAAVAVA